MHLPSSQVQVECLNFFSRVLFFFPGVSGGETIKFVFQRLYFFFPGPTRFGLLDFVCWLLHSIKLACWCWSMVIDWGRQFYQQWALFYVVKNSIHVYRIKLYEYAMLFFFYCAWCIYILYSVPTSFLKSAASAHLQEIRSTQNTWRHFCEFDAAQPPATQPVCEQVSSGVFAYAKCDGWTTPTRNENPKEHVIAMFCSLLVFFQICS